jgi:predicted site-specific integrase-resolvase
VPIIIKSYLKLFIVNNILTSREVMQMLKICENTLLKLEREGKIKPSFRISNRKRYKEEAILSYIKKVSN